MKFQPTIIETEANTTTKTNERPLTMQELEVYKSSLESDFNERGINSVSITIIDRPSYHLEIKITE